MNGYIALPVELHRSLRVSSNERGQNERTLYSTEQMEGQYGSWVTGIGERKRVA